MAESHLSIPVTAEVLAPQIDLTTDVLAKAVVDLFEAGFIETDRALQYFSWLEGRRLLNQCGRAVGPQGVGKRRASEHFQDRDQKRISRIETWTDTSSKKLFSAVLKDINHAAPTGKRQDVRPRVAGSLKPFGIELLIIGNAQNLQREAFIDLHQLHEESGVPVVLVGEPELDSKLSSFNLQNCFPSLFEFDPLDGTDLQKTLRTIEFKVLALPQASNLSEGTSFETLLTSTGGHIGALIEILKEAVALSLSQGYGRIDEAVLKSIASRHGKEYTFPERRNHSALKGR